LFRYNSAIFSTRSAVDYTAIVVTEDFVQGAWWNRTRSDPMFSALASSLQKDAQQLTRLENAECLRAYGTSMLETDWKNVLVVTSLKRNDTLMAAFDHSPDNTYNDITWVCDGDEDGSCDTKSLISEATSWTIPNVLDCQSPTSKKCDRTPAPIQYCLAEPFTSDCSVRINTTILVVVVICNLIKIAALLTTVFAARFEPMVTLGDAICSFLQRPDPLTIASGTLSKADVSRAAKGGCSGDDGWVSSPYQQKKHRWGRAVGVNRWVMTIFL
jgi:hypothetical protein